MLHSDVVNLDAGDFNTYGEIVIARAATKFVMFNSNKSVAVLLSRETSNKPACLKELAVALKLGALSNFTFSSDDTSDNKPVAMEFGMTKADFSTGAKLGPIGAIFLSAWLQHKVGSSSTTL